MNPVSGVSVTCSLSNYIVARTGVPVMEEHREPEPLRKAKVPLKVPAVGVGVNSALQCECGWGWG